MRLGINGRKKQTRRYAVIEFKGYLTMDSAKSLKGTVFCQGDPTDSK